MKRGVVHHTRRILRREPDVSGSCLDDLSTKTALSNRREDDSMEKCRSGKLILYSIIQSVERFIVLVMMLQAKSVGT